MRPDARFPHESGTDEESLHSQHRVTGGAVRSEGRILSAAHDSQSPFFLMPYQNACFLTQSYSLTP